MYAKRGFECESCGTHYERNAKASQYCSRKCKSSGDNKKRTKKVIVPCEGCGKKREYSVYKESSCAIDKYCSKKCYASHQRERLLKQCEKMRNESKEIISQKAIKRYKEQGHPWVGRRHKNISKKKMSLVAKERFKIPENNPMYGKSHSVKSKEKMSETRAIGWVDGKYDDPRKFCEQGYYFSLKLKKELFYRSSWERRYFNYLDNNDNVVTYDTECLRIPYFNTDNHKRWYLPDIWVKFANGNEEIQEIKPVYYTRSEKNKRKFEAGRKYCEGRNIKFRVLTEKYLRYIGVLC